MEDIELMIDLKIDRKHNKKYDIKLWILVKFSIIN